MAVTLESLRLDMLAIHRAAHRELLRQAERAADPVLRREAARRADYAGGIARKLERGERIR
jgi:hypothetical protein